MEVLIQFDGHGTLGDAIQHLDTTDTHTRRFQDARNQLLCDGLVEPGNQKSEPPTVTPKGPTVAAVYRNDR